MISDSVMPSNIAEISRYATADCPDANRVFVGFKFAALKMFHQLQSSFLDVSHLGVRVIWPEIGKVLSRKRRHRRMGNVQFRLDFVLRSSDFVHEIEQEILIVIN